MKRFNTTGICIPEEHYMVDVSEKINKIKGMVQEGFYFTINRARQYGKTTTISLLEKALEKEYYVASISFEGLGQNAFASEENFVRMFKKSVEEILRFTPSMKELYDVWKNETDEPGDMSELSDSITNVCAKCGKKIVLIIDEVDKSSDNQLFLDFLGMLRNKYIQRTKIPTFYSVILAGVYDVKNLKLRLRADEERKYNSPWNIAVDFDVKMEFSTEEIATMLQEYEKDHNTGMDIRTVAAEI